MRTRESWLGQLMGHNSPGWRYKSWTPHASRWTHTYLAGTKTMRTHKHPVDTNHGHKYSSPVQIMDNAPTLLVCTNHGDKRKLFLMQIMNAHENLVRSWTQLSPNRCQVPNNGNPCTAPFPPLPQQHSLVQSTRGCIPCV